MAVPVDSSLTNLTVSTGTLSPAFDPAVTNYSVEVPHTTTSLTFTPTASHGGTLDTWNGMTTAATASGTAATVTPVRSGPNILTVTSTAPGQSAIQYTIIVTKLAAPAPLYDLSLSGLTVSTGTLSPTFAPSTLSYNVDVPYATTSVTVGAAQLDPLNTVTIAKAGYAPNPVIPLIIGNNTVLITVTAPDTTSSVYTVHINRGPAPTADVDLANLALSAGTLTPAFDPSVQSYTALVPYASRFVDITATASTAGHTLTVNGTSMVDGQPATVQVNFDPSGSGYAITVRAANGVEKIYVVTITRDQPSNNADLTALSLSTGALTPTFSTGETAYAATVPYLTTSVSVLATKADATAILRVNNQDTVSGTPSAALPLRVGTNTVTVNVMAEDGVTETRRTLTITRESPNLDLSSLTVTGGTLSPAFAPSTRSYTLDVPFRVASIDVAAVAAEAGWMLEIDGDATSDATVAVPVGATTITVTVTAQYGETRDYTIVVNRAAAAAAVVTAELDFVPGNLATGAPVVFTGSNMLPGSTATITMHSTPVVLASGTVLADGTIVLTARIPAGAEAGAHRFVFDGLSESGAAVTRTAWFTILANGTIGAVSLTGPVAYAEPAAVRALPATGADAAAPLVAGGIVAGVGALLLLLGGAVRRRARA